MKTENPTTYGYVPEQTGGNVWVYRHTRNGTLVVVSFDGGREWEPEYAQYLDEATVYVYDNELDFGQQDCIAYAVVPAYKAREIAEAFERMFC